MQSASFCFGMFWVETGPEVHPILIILFFRRREDLERLEVFN